MTQSTLFTVKKGTCPTYNPDEPNYSPFQNLEDSRLRDACLASEEVQRGYFATANIAHAICLWYCASNFRDYSVLDIAGHTIDRTEAISLLKRFCHRESEIAAINLDRSRYSAPKNRLPSVYGAGVAKALADLAQQV